VNIKERKGFNSSRVAPMRRITPKEVQEHHEEDHHDHKRKGGGGLIH
jgi:hypothetical protein